MEALRSAPLATRFHAVAIVTLVAAGWVMIALPKGDLRHRVLGWIWVSLMSVMGVSSLLVPHDESWVAGYIGGGSALVLMAYGVYAVQRRKLGDHDRTMAILMHDVVFGG